MGNSCRNWNASLVVGVGAVVIGSLLMLDRFGIFDAFNILRLWPLVLVVVGVNMLFRDRTRGGLVGGGMCVIFGIVFLFTQFGYLSWSRTWPVIIIGWGLLLIWDSFRPRAYSPSSTDASGRTVFGSIQKDIVAQDFREANVEIVFAASEVDFTRAEMADSTAYLNVKCVFGSVEVRTPIHWNIIIEANAVFGASENKARPPVPSPNPKTLVIRGEVVFGSIEVKN